MTSRTLVLSACTLLPSVVACDPAPPPAACSTTEPTVHGIWLDAQTIEITIVPVEVGITGVPSFEAVDASEVSGGSIVKQDTNGGLRISLKPSPGSASIVLRPVLDCGATPPTYLVTATIPSTHAPNDPVAVTIAKQ